MTDLLFDQGDGQILKPDDDAFSEYWHKCDNALDQTIRDRAEIIRLLTQIAATCKKISEQQIILAGNTPPRKPRRSSPLYRLAETDRFVMLAKDGKLVVVSVILAPKTAKDLGIEPGMKGRFYDDLTCKPSADSGNRSAWRSWNGCLCLQSRCSFDVPCESEYKIHAVKISETGILEPGELLEEGGSSE